MKMKVKNSQKKILLLRSLLLITIIITGLISCFFSYYFIRLSQHELYTQDFYDLVSDNFQSIRKSLHTQLKMNIQVSVMVGLKCYDTSFWPNCVAPSELYDSGTEQLISLSQVSEFGILPIVTSQTRSSFENYTKHLYEHDPGYPSGTGSNGIFAYDSNGHKIYSNISFGFSKYDILTPIAQMSDPNETYVNILYNAHSDPMYAKTIDNMIDCVTKLTSDMTWNQASRINNMNILRTQCSSITDFIPSGNKHTSSIGTPIIPYSDPTLVGFSGAIFSWESMILSTITPQSSFKCVIESSTSSDKLVFHVRKGDVQQKYPNPRTKLTKKFDKMLTKKYILNQEGEFVDGPQYTITYHSHYKSQSSFPAIIACACCIGVTIIISLIFELFNILISQEANETNILLNSKRIFVRFISHEIR